MTRWSVGVAVLGFGVGVATAAGVIHSQRYDPLAVARLAGITVQNREASVPPMCYTKTDGRANPCWVCHTQGTGLNFKNDSDLQREYSFSQTAQTNHWTNLFVDRSAAIAAQTDDDILRWVGDDNLTPLRRALARQPQYGGYVPDLDFAKGFDDTGFARDGSGWRAVRYKPFSGTFWPTNGSVGEVYIRLPSSFRTTAAGHPSREVAKINLAILEAAMTSPSQVPDHEIGRTIEPVDERLVGLDLDHDGSLSIAKRAVGLPQHYVGGAAHLSVTRGSFPQGTELLHPVRYLDPTVPTMAATRLKELRYALKTNSFDAAQLSEHYAEEAEDKERGKLPRFQGNPELGYLNGLGWVFQGFIEDADGRLRLQTHEEHLACMGCHSGLGVTQDATFSFARKVPGVDGWRVQDTRGMPDVPQWRHHRPEALTYLQRAKGGDDLRSNTETIEAWLDEDGQPQVTQLTDLSSLVLPSRVRAMRLNKAYRALVGEQRFVFGRDAVLAPPAHVHRIMDNGNTGLEAAGLVFDDGSLFLDWENSALATGPFTGTNSLPERHSDERSAAY